ncbi:hypothetical protein [uncultured Gammaproteobacteria bacterium]|nr:hypothetical protein [uncultured Gammaproteobacteria bacterium]
MENHPRNHQQTLSTRSRRRPPQQHSLPILPTHPPLPS